MDSVKTEHFTILATDTSVLAHAQTPIPFDHLSGNQQAFRSALRQAVTALRPVPGHCFVGRYSGPNTPHCDVENALFYNIGTASFRHLGLNTLLIERLPEQRLPLAEQGAFPYTYDYHFEPPKDLSTPPAAEWDTIPTAGFRGSKSLFSSGWH